MKMLYFNCKGIARPDKKLAMCRLLKSKSIDVVFLQETLGSADAISILLQPMLPGWVFHAIDVIGQ